MKTISFLLFFSISGSVGAQTKALEPGLFQKQEIGHFKDGFSFKSKKHAGSNVGEEAQQTLIYSVFKTLPIGRFDPNSRFFADLDIEAYQEKLQQKLNQLSGMIPESLFGSSMELNQAELLKAKGQQHGLESEDSEEKPGAASQVATIVVPGIISLMQQTTPGSHSSNNNQQSTQQSNQAPTPVTQASASATTASAYSATAATSPAFASRQQPSENKQDATNSVMMLHKILPFLGDSASELMKVRLVSRAWENTIGNYLPGEVWENVFSESPQLFTRVCKPENKQWLDCLERVGGIPKQFLPESSEKRYIRAEPGTFIGANNALKLKATLHAWEGNAPLIERKHAKVIQVESVSNGQILRSITFPPLMESESKAAMAMAKKESQHPNSFMILMAVGSMYNSVYLETEYTDGLKLDHLLFSYSYEKGRSNVAKCVLRQILSSLSYFYIVHDGQIHGNISPASIFLRKDGCVKLGIFGMTTPELFEMNKEYYQHSLYAAPEVLKGAPRTHQSDMWAVGMSLLSIQLEHPLLPPLQRIHVGDVMPEAQYKTISDIKIYTAKRKEVENLLASADDELWTKTVVDPELRRIIRACLNPDPKQRSSSLSLEAEILELGGVDHSLNPWSTPKESLDFEPSKLSVKAIEENLLKKLKKLRENRRAYFPAKYEKENRDSIKKNQKYTWDFMRRFQSDITLLVQMGALNNRLNSPQQQQQNRNGDENRQ